MIFLSAKYFNLFKVEPRMRLVRDKIPDIDNLIYKSYWGYVCLVKDRYHIYKNNPETPIIIDKPSITIKDHLITLSLKYIQPPYAFGIGSDDTGVLLRWDSNYTIENFRVIPEHVHNLVYNFYGVFVRVSWSETWIRYNLDLSIYESTDIPFHKYYQIHRDYILYSSPEIIRVYKFQCLKREGFSDRKDSFSNYLLFEHTLVNRASVITWNHWYLASSNILYRIEISTGEITYYDIPRGKIFRLDTLYNRVWIHLSQSEGVSTFQVVLLTPVIPRSSLSSLSIKRSCIII